jgi:hypothetical protein
VATMRWTAGHQRGRARGDGTGGTGGKGVCIFYPFTLTAWLLALATILVWSLSGRPASATLLRLSLRVDLIYNIVYESLL